VVRDCRAAVSGGGGSGATGSRGASKWLWRSSPIVRAAHRALRRPPSDDDPISTNTTAPVVSPRLGTDTVRPGARENCRNVLPEGLFIGYPRAPQECVDEAWFQVFVRHSIPFVKFSLVAGEHSAVVSRPSIIRRVVCCDIRAIAESLRDAHSRPGGGVLTSSSCLHLTQESAITSTGMPTSANADVQLATATACRTQPHYSSKADQRESVFPLAVFQKPRGSIKALSLVVN
jgi:hypothetical protein